MAYSLPLKLCHPTEPVQLQDSVPEFCILESQAKGGSLNPQVPPVGFGLFASLTQITGTCLLKSSY